MKSFTKVNIKMEKRMGWGRSRVQMELIAKEDTRKARNMAKE